MTISQIREKARPLGEEYVYVWLRTQRTHVTLQASSKKRVFVPI